MERKYSGIYDGNELNAGRQMTVIQLACKADCMNSLSKVRLELRSN